MNEKASELLTQGLDKAMEYIEATESFVVEQAPLLVQEVLAYGLFEAAVYATICVGVMALFIYFYHVIKVVVNRNEGEGEFERCQPLPLVMLALAWLAPFCIGVGWLLDIGKIVFAPRLYLIEVMRALLPPATGG